MTNTGSRVRRVVQILPELNSGGVERGVVELNRELVKRGIDSWVISDGGQQVPSIEQDGGHHRSLGVCSKNPLTALMRAAQLRRTLQEIAPDIIHARSRVPAWLCRIANRRPRRAFVTTVHGLNSISRYSRVMISGDRVITVSDIVRDYVCDGYGVSPDSMTVVQRGVDMNVFHREAVDRKRMAEFREEHGLQDRYVVTSVGRITWLKDYETFIRSIARCQSQLPQICGLIVGGAADSKQGYLESLKQLAHDEGVADRIVFAGVQSRMPEIYALSDITVNASLKMGNMGRTVGESLAMGTPVIATTWPGLENLVQDGVNGQVVDNQSPEQMQAAIEQIAQSEMNTPDHQATIRGTVPHEYTLDAMVDQVIEVYDSLMPE